MADFRGSIVLGGSIISRKTVALQRASEAAQTSTELSYDGAYPEHEPYGTGIGAMPELIGMMGQEYFE